MFKCLIGHKWIYGTEKVTYKRLGSYYRQSNNDSLEYDHKSRYCVRCSKKQVLMVGGKWRDWNLNKVEKRDSKLNDLGI